MEATRLEIQSEDLHGRTCGFCLSVPGSLHSLEFYFSFICFPANLSCLWLNKIPLCMCATFLLSIDELSFGLGRFHFLHCERARNEGG